tara:strand:- start:146 stop:709 length:564 start_codon:yes stop_codon:yes gene_type:complete
MKGQVAKSLLRTAGEGLKNYLDDALRLGGTVGQELATAGLRAGKSKFAPQLVNAATKEVPKLLREGAKSPIPFAGKLLGQAAVGGGLLYGASLLDQQSEHTQPMTNQLGNAELQNFYMSQQLQNQKFMHDMALVQARAESRTPGAQFAGGSLTDAARAEQLMTEAGEVTNREVKDIARMIYGTGLRA